MAHSPTIKQLRYLCAVARFQHFGRAASSLHISQSTLSTAILELEQALGVRLVERSNKGVLLTALGEDVVERSHAILTSVSDLMSLCDSSQGEFSSRMRLGVIPTIAPFLLPEILSGLRQAYPQFQLYIREDLSARLINSLKRGELDLLLLALPYPAEGVETLRLFDDDFFLAFPDGHEVGRMQSLRSRDLKGRELLLLEDGHCMRDHALEVCKLKDSDVQAPYQASSLNTIVQMVANGIGVSLLPQMALQANLLSATNVKTRAFDEPNISRQIGLMWRQKCPREDEFRKLGHFIVEQHVTDDVKQVG